MGTTISSPRQNTNLSMPSQTNNEQEMIKLMMPLYYSVEAITNRDRALTSKTWEMILSNESPEYILQKTTNTTFQYQRCIDFFFDSFYLRLFDIHPICRKLFKTDMSNQGNFLVKMISLALSELEDPRRFDTTLRKLAEVHYERGVKAFEYGIVGEVLFWVLKHVLGKETYTKEVHIAWVKIYNRMLHIMVPVAVALELHTGPPAVSVQDFVSASVSSQDPERTVVMAGNKNSASILKSEQLRGAEGMPATYLTTPITHISMNITTNSLNNNNNSNSIKAAQAQSTAASLQRHRDEDENNTMRSPTHRITWSS